MTDIVERLRAPAYWMSGSSEGHEGENDAPREAADRITALRAENEKLRAALRDARECVQAWSGYASEYFREKHDLAGDLARIDAALEEKP